MSKRVCKNELLQFLVCTETKAIMSISGVKYSESKAIYKEANRLTEKWIKLVYVLIVKVSIQCFVIPEIFITFFIYFTTDVGNDAFVLLLPLWYVLSIRYTFQFPYFLSVNLFFMFISSFFFFSKLKATI